MTLLLTEVSTAGIAMVADTKICWVDTQSGEIITNKQPVFQQKLFKIRRLGPLQLPGAVSYWGAFGLIIPSETDFESWIRGIASYTMANSLAEFATELTVQLNAHCNDNVVSQLVGFHIAGYDIWSDYAVRPVFWHIHNGHYHKAIVTNGDDNPIAIPTGSANIDQPMTAEEGLLRRLVRQREIKNQSKSLYDKAPRKLFEVHCDFPNEKRDIKDNLKVLGQGYLTANGEYDKVLLKRELEFLMEKRGMQSTRSRPADTGYLKQRVSWMIDIANQVSREVRQEGYIPTFGGKYHKLAFDQFEVFLDDVSDNQSFGAAL